MPHSNDWEKEFAEAGDMHSEDCCVNSESGCDGGTGILDCCDNMRFLKRTTDKALLSQKQELAEKVEKLYVGYSDRTEDRDDSQDDAFEDGAEVMQKKVLKLLQEPSSDTGL